MTAESVVLAVVVLMATVTAVSVCDHNQEVALEIRHGVNAFPTNIPPLAVGTVTFLNGVQTAGDRDEEPSNAPQQPTAPAEPLDMNAEFPPPVSSRDRSRKGRLERALSDPKNIELAKDMTLAKAREILKENFLLKFDADYTLFLIIVAETYFVPILDVLVNLGIKAPVSSGKSTALRAFKILGDKVELAVSATPASIPPLAAICNALAIDRIDRRLKSDDGPMLAQLIDASYERGLQYRKMVVDEGRRWVLRSYDVFGVRILTYTESLWEQYTSTASRTPEVTMLPARSWKVRRNAQLLEATLAPVVLWLRRITSEALAKFSPGDFESMLHHPQYEEFAASLDVLLEAQAGALDRTAQMAESMWRIAHLLGWEIETELHDWMRATHEEQLRAAGAGNGAWSEADEQRWAKVSLDALKKFVIVETKLQLEEETLLVPVGWSWRAAKVAVLGYVARYGGLGTAEAENVPTPIKAVIYMQMNRAGLLPLQGTLDRVSKTDARRAVCFDVGRLRALGLPIREVEPLGTAVAPLNPPVSPVPPVPRNRLPIEDFGTGESKSTPVSPVTNNRTPPPVRKPEEPEGPGGDGSRGSRQRTRHGNRRNREDREMDESGTPSPSAAARPGDSEGAG